MQAIPLITSKAVTNFPGRGAFLLTSREIHWLQQIGTWDSRPISQQSNLEVIMKSLLSAVVVASALIVPAVSFAQQANGPVTRAQVRAELVAAQKAGLVYQNDTQYPKTVAQGDAAVVASAQASQDVGGVNGGSSSAGAPSSVQQRLFSAYRGQ
jgi:hypothetical protein